MRNQESEIGFLGATAGLPSSGLHYLFERALVSFRDLDEVAEAMGRFARIRGNRGLLTEKGIRYGFPGITQVFVMFSLLNPAAISFFRFHHHILSSFHHSLLLYDKE